MANEKGTLDYMSAGDTWSFAAGGISTLLGTIAANRLGREQARGLRQQAGLYSLQSGMLLKGASMYSNMARGAAAIGERNATNLRLSAAQLDYFEQQSLRESILAARQRIGQGRTTFAANGVLVDSGSAAMWEQDEAADAALERLDIMQQYENQSWQYRTQANLAEAEGYAAAAQHAGSAMQSAGQAYASALQAQYALQQAQRAERKRHGGILGTIAGGAIGFVASGFNPAGAALGAHVGGSIGGSYDAYRGKGIY